jgi:DNA/RNA-binding domain of Phe-tRNA-synthetase-like protein
VWAEGIAPPTLTDAVPSFILELVARAQREGDLFVPEEMRRRVRQIFRHGKYKPSGRSKPASEFLLRAAIDGSFPLVNGPVDVNNAISLESGLPGSIFDVALSGSHLLLRRGLADEAYVFNPSGQTIDLEDLLVVCRKTPGGWEPCGNAVKDSMSTKIRPETRDVVAVLYAPIDEPVEGLETWAAKFAELLSAHCEAERSGFHVVIEATGAL